MTLYYFLAYLVAYRVSLPALFLQVTICEVFLTLPLQPIKLQHLVSQARGRIGKLGNVFFTLLGDEHSIDNNTNEFANILCKIIFSNWQFKLTKYWWGQLCLSQTLVVTDLMQTYALGTYTELETSAFKNRGRNVMFKLTDKHT